LAVHEAAEYWERSGRKASLEDMLRVYHESYDKHTQRLLSDTPNAEYWFSSGKFEGPEDIPRRRAIGATMVERYYDYYVNQKPGEVIWVTPKGEPAIELGFSVYFGSVLVRGFIDQIIPEIMRDIKSGNKPGTIFQLATYRYAVYDEHGVDIRKGDFWMGKNGKPTKPYDLDNMSRQQVTDLYERLDQGVKSEDFDPAPSVEKCGRCSVRTACVYAM
jgi:putative RecB family exonuclease